MSDCLIDTEERKKTITTDDCQFSLYPTSTKNLAGYIIEWIHDAVCGRNLFRRLGVRHLLGLGLGLDLVGTASIAIFLSRTWRMAD